MYQLDSQGRLTIPDELLELLQYELKNNVCAICIDVEKREAYILPKERLSPSDMVLVTRPIDNKGRFFVKAITKFWGNPQEYLIYFKDEKIWIREMI